MTIDVFHSDKNGRAHLHRVTDYSPPRKCVDGIEFLIPGDISISETALRACTGRLQRRIPESPDLQAIDGTLVSHDLEHEEGGEG